MATSMAAAIAAAMPAAQQAPTPVQPTYEAIPSNMQDAIDTEAQIPIRVVQLDALVASKIIKHSAEAQSSPALGLLLGIDLNGTLEISNSFALPHTSEEEEKTNRTLARYQLSMMRLLKDAQADGDVVGFYQSNFLGAFFKQSLLDLQTTHQERLRRGGIVIVHDTTQASLGNAAFRAFRLTQNYLKANKAKRFNTQSLVEHGLTFSSIVEEIPLRIRTNPLTSAFVNMLTTPTPASTSSSTSLPAPNAPLNPSFDLLGLSSGSITQNLTRVVESLDDYKTEEGNLAFLQRQIAREKAKAETYVQKRREENALRASQGLAPLPDEDISRLFKIPPEPSRLESMLLLGQVDAYSKSLADTTSVALVKMYAANAGHSV